MRRNEEDPSPSSHSPFVPPKSSDISYNLIQSASSFPRTPFLFQMAISKSSEETEDEFVLRSGARSRLKREFAFAVRAQAEFVNLIGRTRSMKVYRRQGTSGGLGKQRAKKLKVADAFSESKVESEEGVIVIEENQGAGLDGGAPGGRTDGEHAAPPMNDVKEEVVETEMASPPPDEALVDADGIVEVAKTDWIEIKVKEEPDGVVVNETDGVLLDGEGPKGLANDSEMVIDETDGVLLSGEGLKGLANENSTPQAAPGRRFTRSALKGCLDSMEITVDGAVASAMPVELKEEPTDISVKSENDESVVGDLKVAKVGGRLKSRPGPKKKLELKMSKKIASTKLPSNVTELLATGLLEGMPVRYRLGANKDDLEGMVKDGKIMCFCESCKGSKLVTAIQFEQHAHSLRKHPAPNIYFGNGKTMRDVLDACRTAPLDNLEATIQMAVGASPVKALPVEGTSICQKCEESFDQQSQDQNVGLISNKCLELEVPDATPAPEMDGGSRSSKLPVIQNSSKSISKSSSSEKKNVKGRLTRKDLRLHKLVFMEDVLPDGTEVAYYVRGKVVDINELSDCSRVTKWGMAYSVDAATVSPSQFEAHAGWASRRKPYLHIFTSNGVSLHELALSLSKDQKFSVSDNDDLCTICADFGDLLLCDGCPRAYHPDCVGLSSIPVGDWYCRYCKTMFEKEKNAERSVNALAAGRVIGIDPIEQITKRCIRMVKTSEPDVTVCVLCSLSMVLADLTGIPLVVLAALMLGLVEVVLCHDFSKAGFGPRTVLLCDQCEKEFHVGCLKEHNMQDLKELPKGKWFCCMDCNKIHSAMEKLVFRGSEKLPDSLLDVVRRKHEEKSLSSVDLDVQWRVLSGKIATPDSRSLLSRAVAILHDCFDPIIDTMQGKDLIPAMVYGRNMRDQEFGGMYCAILTINSTIVSVGILRIFGREVAELPLVATSKENQGQGFFQSLFSCIERLLGFLEVKNLLLPAADEAESIWTKRFGFKKISPEQLAEHAKDLRMMVFEGTSMLHKEVPKCRIISKQASPGD
ncbi:hypothetical protein ACLOJK_025243 [Asimina triloba]